MSGGALLAGLLAAVAVLLSRPSRRARAARMPPAARRPPGPGGPGAAGGPAAEPSALTWGAANPVPVGAAPTPAPAAGRTAGVAGPALRLLAALPAGAGVALVLGGPAGLLVGAGTVPVLVVLLGRLEPPGARRRRERLRADLPHAVDLLAACLAAGRPPGPAVEQVGAAVGDPVGDDLAVSTARLRLGADPVAVWRELGRHPELGPLGRALARAAESGASVAGAIARLAEDLRVEARAEVEARARAVGVRAAIPLGVCLLPAFVLVGVVPLVAGSFGELLGP